MATTQPINLQPRPNVKQINYLAKTFGDFRQNLIDFAKAYYPNTYSDFNETSPGMMFIEMASYVGDVLSFYIDNSFKENLLAYAEQQENVTTIAQFLGYKPKLTAAASTIATVYQLAPAIVQDGVYVPNPKYLLKIKAGSAFSTSGPNVVQFRLTEDVDFTTSTAENYIINTLANGNPQTFIVSKPAKLIAAEEKTTTFTFGSPQKFTSVVLPDNNIIGIKSVVDSDSNPWYEVDFLAQDLIMDDVDVTGNEESGTLPSAKLRLKKVSRRFVTRINRDMQTELMFGSGTSNDAELNLTLDSRQVANQQYGNTIQNLLGNVALNNVNYLNSNAFGLAPANTTLTVTYWVGGGVLGNTPSNTIVNVDNLIIGNDTTQYTSAESQTFTAAIRSATITNNDPATGGGAGESIDEMRENALGFFNAQNRVVTVEDYITRTYSLPSKYGRISKAFAIRDEQINQIQALDNTRYVNNPVKPNVINLYTLGYDSNGKLTTLNTVVKENLARYLEQFRLLTDDVNILDAFIINIGVKFDITVFRNYNLNDVLSRSIGAVQEFFNTSKWDIGQPIILADLMYTIGSVEGVQNVKKVEVFNKYQFKDGPDYQNYRYSIEEATVDGIIYPSLDPSVFELKYPQTDIIGTATQ